MSKRLYVGSLPYSVTETTLRDLFTPLGEVTQVNIITDRETGQSKGFGFVEMADDEAAKQAISQMNGKTVDNRQIQVSEARPREQRSFSGDRSRSGGGSGRGRRNSW